MMPSNLLPKTDKKILRQNTTWLSSVCTDAGLWILEKNRCTDDDACAWQTASMNLDGQIWLTMLKLSRLAATSHAPPLRPAHTLVNYYTRKQPSLPATLESNQICADRSVESVHIDQLQKISDWNEFLRNFKPFNAMILYNQFTVDAHAMIAIQIESQEYDMLVPN